MRLKRNRKIVPVLMFHSVGLENHPWEWSYISESVATFEAKIALLRRKGFNAITWAELFDYMEGKRDLPLDSILLTFDDGYLDNWVHVYPILKRYDMRGTIFVNPEFVDPIESARPNWEDVRSNKVAKSELQVAGFLSWEEMRQMERSGFMDIQSHAMSHTWYFTGPKIEGFHVPELMNSRPWLAWNARPAHKPYYLTERQAEFVPYGYPVFEHEKSLIAKRFFPDDDAVSNVVDYVNAMGGRGYFKDPGWEVDLRRWTKRQFGEESFPGSYENEEEREKRVRSELSRSKQLIEQNLKKQVDFICWPGGGTNKNVERLAKEVGYKSWTLSSRDQTSKRNLPGTDAAYIKRIGTDNRMHFRGRYTATGGALHQWLQIASHQRSSAHLAMLRAYKLASMVLPGRRT